MLLCSVLPDASLCRFFRLGPGSVLLRFDCVFRNRPGSAQPLRAWNSSVQSVLIHPAHRDAPALCRFLYREITFHDGTSYHGFTASGGELVSHLKPYYIPFFAEDKQKMEIHQKISLRNLHPLLPEPYLHASTGERTCSKWRGYSLNTHLRSQAVHHEISEAQYNQRLNEKEYSPTVFCKLYRLSRAYI